MQVERVGHISGDAWTYVARGCGKEAFYACHFHGHSADHGGLTFCLSVTETGESRMVKELRFRD